MALIGDLLLVCTPTEAEALLQPLLNAVLVPILREAQKLDPTDTGVVFMFWRVGETRFKPLVTLHGGYVPPEKDAWYIGNAERKLNALADNPRIFSTFECADDAMGLYGGGLRLFGGRVVHISAGLNPWFDEMVDCVMAWSLGHATVTEMRQVAQISRNPHLSAWLDDLEKKLQDALQ